MYILYSLWKSELYRKGKECNGMEKEKTVALEGFLGLLQAHPSPWYVKKERHMA